MVDVKSFYEALKKNNVDLFTGVPDSLLKSFCAYVTDHSDTKQNIITANEGSAIGLAAGHYLASGKPALVYMQNSGIGNAVNPLLSLADEKVYSIPMLLMIGWRGEPSVHDEPQHLKQGAVTLPLLEAMQIPYIVLSEDTDVAISQLHDIVKDCIQTSKPQAIVIRKNTFSTYKLIKKVENNYPLLREQALEMLLKGMDSNDAIVSTTGKLSRELFELREKRGEGHGKDFLTVGSMGHSSSIALGLALESPDKRIWCFDGDGAFIMHMGAISNIGHAKPKNIVHVVFNNGAHESVGGQPTVAFNLDIPSIAKACGYEYTYSVSNGIELIDAIKTISNQDGPILLEIKLNTGSREDLGRPTTTPMQNRDAFMTSFK